MGQDRARCPLQLSFVWDLTNREDWGIEELSQAGIQSRAYTPGPYSSREELLHVFDTIILGE